MDFVTKVIMSCKTLEQLEVCDKWIMKVSIPQTECVFSDLSIRLQYKSAILSMKEYLFKKQELGDSNGSEVK
jgi:hypothetical protein